MSDRSINFEKPYICFFYPMSDNVNIAVFDIDEPKKNAEGGRKIRTFNSNYNLNDLSAKIIINKGKVSEVISKSSQALSIARNYRPGIGRTSPAVYASIILWNNRPKLENVRFPNTNNVDIFIQNEIEDAFGARHPDINPHTIVNTEPRFIAIPYFTRIKTGLLGLVNIFAHFVTLIVDLDHRDDKGNYKPFVYVYDSAHFLCRSYGAFSHNLNKDFYFKFGDKILVDDQVLNNIIGVRLARTLNSLSGFIQPIYDFRCGYYCEAAINLLLRNSTFTSKKVGGYPLYGQQTREFLMEILSNKNVGNEISLIKPPLPFELFS